jgi:glycosyltransferase involved in cell wall biosynthesis
MRVSFSSSFVVRGSEGAREMKVLFFAFAFPPANYAATPRAWNMARVLAESGCEVDVVTVRPDRWLRVNSMEESSVPRIRRIEVSARRAYLVPWVLKPAVYPGSALIGGMARRMARTMGVEPHSGWAIEAEKATADLLPEQVDVVLATGAPFVSFDLARRTAERLGRPYVLDYRDLWTHNPHRGARERGSPERKIVRDAAAVIAVSQSVLEVLDREYDLGARGHVLPNAFDEAEMAVVTPTPFDHFAIVYAGQFYPPKRIPDPLLAALRHLSVPDWRFHYAGPHTDLVLRAASSLEVADRVVCHGNLTRQESLALTAGADLAVVITSVAAAADAADRGIVTSKIFDILGLQRPMLVIAPPGSDVDAIVAGRESTGCFPAHQTQEIARWIDSMSAAGARPSPSGAHSWRRRGEVLRGILVEAAAS